jgi:magnesium chelatase subunit D
MQPSFPFTAIVGQETLKRALLLSIIQPSLGGVLIRGTKGVAKSTAVRALAALLPPIETVAGCPFQRQPGEEVPDWPLPEDAPPCVRPVPLIELPLGATEDRVLGALHLEKALRGERAFEPGLLAAAHRGILYIDEVNLLPDHLVDILLDAAASGVHRVEREGLSLSHPARFVLVGTMNPEEGDLRPQLLDRFGLVVDVADLADPAQRAEVVRRRLAYETDPTGFTAAWKAADATEAERIRNAQQLLPQVSVSEALLRSVSERCLAAHVEGLRADLTLCKAACAWAAYDGRTAVAPADVETVAELALAHRRTQPPSPPPPSPPPPRGPGGRGGEGARGRGGEGATGGGRAAPSAPSKNDSLVLESMGLFAARPQPSKRTLAASALPGRWRPGAAQRCSAAVRAVSVFGSEGLLAWADTLRAAAPYQAERGRTGLAARVRLRAVDLRTWPRRGPVGCLLLFVIDASGSMAAWQRMRQTKAAVGALLHRAYQRRDRIAFLTFRGSGAELTLPPGRGLAAARQTLADLAVGGTTPLAHGLAAARRFVQSRQRRQPRQPIWTVLLTDGRTNVAVRSDDPWQDALFEAAALAACVTECLVVDTEIGWPHWGRAGELARALGAQCLCVEDVLGRPLPAVG